VVSLGKNERTVPGALGMPISLRQPSASQTAPTW
jgi:hypothetical protein